MVTFFIRPPEVATNTECEASTRQAGMQGVHEQDQSTRARGGSGVYGLRAGGQEDARWVVLSQAWPARTCPRPLPPQNSLIKD